MLKQGYFTDCEIKARFYLHSQRYLVIPNVIYTSMTQPTTTTEEINYFNLKVDTNHWFSLQEFKTDSVKQITTYTSQNMTHYCFYKL